MTPSLGARQRLELELQTPAGFAYQASRGQWLPAPHLVFLSTKLQQACTGAIKRLMIFMPPRHGKSLATSEYLPPYKLKWWPDHRVILTSYEADFASDWGRKARDVIEQNPALVGVRLRQDSTARSRWDLEGRRGGMSTAGVGGPITGKGAHLLIIDDPVKNAEEANSAAVREMHKEWWKSTARTRIEPGGCAILMCTRWHEDDLAGWLLSEMQQGGDAWDVIAMPALAEADENWGDGLFVRTKGQALWPERYDEAWMAQTERALGPYWWASLYLQRPQPASGGKFKREWFRYFRQSADGSTYILYTAAGEKLVPVTRCWRFSTSDLAVSLRQQADYFVNSVWAVTPDNELLWLDMARDRLEGPDQVPLIKTMSERWSLSFVGIERTGYQLATVQAARRQGLAVKELKADLDKLARSIPAQTRMQHEQVFLPAGAAWLGDAERELLAFPTGAHDDIVDTLSYAAIEVNGGTAEPQIRRL